MAELSPQPRAHTRALPAALLLAALLAVLAAGAAAQVGERPLATPRAATPDAVLPGWGVRMGLGVLRPSVELEGLDAPIAGSGGPGGAVAITLDAGLGAFRLGYARELYRHDLPPGTTTPAGEAVDALAYDADQLWAFHGLRPLHPLYLAYGIGWQLRLVRLSRDGDTVEQRREALLQGGLLAEYDLALPFALQLRYVQDVGGDLVQRRAASLHLVYHVPY